MPVTGVDVQSDAVALATKNAQQLGLDNAHFLSGSWYSPLDQTRFALIASNPPYIDADDVHLSQGDVRFEPASALIAADNGLADLRTIIESAPHYLAAGGWLLLEHGWQQADAVRQLLQARGFTQIETCQDYGGNDRVSLGRWLDAPTH